MFCFGNIMVAQVLDKLWGKFPHTEIGWSFIILYSENFVFKIEKIHLFSNLQFIVICVLFSILDLLIW